MCRAFTKWANSDSLCCTLIKADFELDKNADSVAPDQKGANPEAYGVVNLNDKNEIVELVEKPETFVSDEAVIGIYYFKDAVFEKRLLCS